MSFIGEVTCPECNKRFRWEQIGEHSSFVHKYTNRERQILQFHLGVEITVPVPQLSFKCDHCSKNFERKVELNAHIVEKHAGQIQPALPSAWIILCPFEDCEQSFDTAEDVASHCSIAHSLQANLKFEVLNKSFDSINDFLEWRSRVEEESCTSFRFRSSVDKEIVEYSCHYNPHVVTHNHSDEPSCKKFRKSEKLCPAFIKCHVRGDDSIEVLACTDHVGHPLVTEKLLLTDGQKAELKELLSRNVGTHDITMLMKEKYSSQSRMFYLTPIDIALLRETNSVDRGDEGPGEVEEFPCPECNVDAMPLEKLRVHIRELHDIYSPEREEFEKPLQNNLYYACAPSVCDATYHGSRDSVHAVTPLPESITCPMCGSVFRTKYQLVVHYISVHDNLMNESSIVQTSFSSWKQFEPWLEKMERNTGSVLIKTRMHACGTKLIHTYNCQFDKVVVSKTAREDEPAVKSIDCPEFVKVIENEDGVLDCVGFFNHLGHTAEAQESDECREKDTARDNFCSICGNTVPPEVDATIAECVIWVRCNVYECRSLAHEWCAQLLGRNCMECGTGLLVADAEKRATFNTEGIKFTERRHKI
ncbi:hypothetical protein Q1695_009271 [Nippostrongylus brasiliensis]|nr:hypothetical protein Q1695_009271 [Nippostrongylus brasiliensis]